MFVSGLKRSDRLDSPSPHELIQSQAGEVTLSLSLSHLHEHAKATAAEAPRVCVCSGGICSVATACAQGDVKTLKSHP